MPASLKSLLEPKKLKTEIKRLEQAAHRLKKKQGESSEHGALKQQIKALREKLGKIQELIPLAIKDYTDKLDKLRKSKTSSEDLKENKKQWLETRLQEKLDEMNTESSGSKRSLIPQDGNLGTTAGLETPCAKKRRGLLSDSPATYSNASTPQQQKIGYAHALGSLAMSFEEDAKARTSAEQGRTFTEQGRLEHAKTRSSLLQALLELKDSSEIHQIVPPSPMSRVVPPSPVASRRIVKAVDPRYSNLKRAPSVPRIDEAEEEDDDVVMMPVVAVAGNENTSNTPGDDGGTAGNPKVTAFALDGWHASTYEEYQGLFLAFHNYVDGGKLPPQEMGKLILRFASFSMCLRETYTKDTCGCNLQMIGRPNQEKNTFIKDLLSQYSNSAVLVDFVKWIVAALPKNYQFPTTNLYDTFKNTISQYINEYLIKQVKVGYRLNGIVVEAEILKSCKDDDHMWSFDVKFLDPATNAVRTKSTVVEKLELFYS